MMKTRLNADETLILKTVKEFEEAGRKTNYYALLEQLERKGRNLSKMIPLFSRLEDEDFVRSDGLIYRYFHLTEKGVEHAST